MNDEKVKVNKQNSLGKINCIDLQDKMSKSFKISAKGPNSTTVSIAVKKSGVDVNVVIVFGRGRRDDNNRPQPFSSQVLRWRHQQD